MFDHYCRRRSKRQQPKATTASTPAKKPKTSKGTPAKGKAPKSGKKAADVAPPKTPSKQRKMSEGLHEPVTPLYVVILLFSDHTLTSVLYSHVKKNLAYVKLFVSTPTSLMYVSNVLIGSPPQPPSVLKKMASLKLGSSPIKPTPDDEVKYVLLCLF